MNIQDKLRHWIIEQLEIRGRGGRARLAERLNLSPSQLSNMLNTEAGKETRNIQADELLEILDFLEIEELKPLLSRINSELQTECKSNRATLIHIYDNAPPKQQAALAKLTHIFGNAKPKQREAIAKLVQSFAETYNIPH